MIETKHHIRMGDSDTHTSLHVQAGAYATVRPSWCKSTIPVPSRVQRQAQKLCIHTQSHSQNTMLARCQKTTARCQDLRKDTHRTLAPNTSTHSAMHTWFWPSLLVPWRPGSSDIPRPPVCVCLPPLPRGESERISAEWRCCWCWCAALCSSAPALSGLSSTECV